MTKDYKFNGDEIKELVPNLGFAFATDKIMIDGNQVDFMVRQEPDRPGDSGWVFYGGGETQEYLDDPENTSLYAVNTIANYDPEIVRFLTYPPGTEIERNRDGRLQIITEEVEEPEVVFLAPAEVGKNFTTRSWSFDISKRLLKRIDNNSLVMWRPGFTIWFDSFNTDGDIEDRINDVLDTISKDKTEFLRAKEKDFQKMRYYLDEVNDGETQSAMYAFAFSETQEMRMAIYFDSEEERTELEKIWSTIQFHPAN